MPSKRLKFSGGGESEEGKKEKTSLMQRAKKKAAETFENLYPGYHRKEGQAAQKAARSSSTSPTVNMKRLPEDNVGSNGETRTASMKHMLIEAIDGIHLDYTEQDVFKSLGSTQMYAAFPHLVEGDEKAQAAPLSADDALSMIDHEELDDGSRSEREGSAPASAAGPSNSARYSSMNRSTSTMESIQEGTSAHRSGSARAGRSNLSVNYTYDSESDNVSMKSTRPVVTLPTAEEEIPVKPRRKNFFTEIGLKFEKNTKET